ncbi:MULTISPECIES: DUF2267 domain-containing protein [Limnochorda]|uniref:DUF2267 domain-containing protein n=1 Tax=Limnochorda TaxID=1676651 RepID=UPI0017A8A6AB|nr:DUF2267 domain-containing protein [Limnochorda pilosa]MBO2486394.1 DUF2267 domain-containing protein [Bacillota bacterium]MBO2518753.1 DUF2267 domain-containing protein [Bacillota bacterium]NMA70419.1 DUF2267 domain-containing protein [Bacillota bacterium]
MQHDEFIGHVQHRARLASRGEAERATRAVLQTLAERLTGGAAENLAAQLPPQLQAYMHKGDMEAAEELTLDEFFHRVSEREGVDLPKSVHHARCVVDVLKEAVSPGQIEKVRAQLPDGWASLFDSGSEGDMDVE